MARSIALRLVAGQYRSAYIALFAESDVVLAELS